jgi:hypothetical protein
MIIMQSTSPTQHREHFTFSYIFPRFSPQAGSTCSFFSAFGSFHKLSSDRSLAQQFQAQAQPTSLSASLARATPRPSGGRRPLRRGARGGATTPPGPLPGGFVGGAVPVVDFTILRGMDLYWLMPGISLDWKK